MASSDEHPITRNDKPAYYRIRVQGILKARWSDWFDDFEITHDPNGETVLTGPVADQSALYGIIGRARDLGLTLISVEREG
jgi:hypothetical protein